MREFLMGLYIEHGDREFERYNIAGNLFWGAYCELFISCQIDHAYHGNKTKYKLTPKAIEYIKSLDNP